MSEPTSDDFYDDLDIDNEQVTSNECWDIDESANVPHRIYKDLNIGAEQVTSNECYDLEEK
jgi:hypothetical protein